MMQLWRGATVVIAAAIGATGRPEERAAGTAVLERAGDERATSGRRAGDERATSAFDRSRR